MAGPMSFTSWGRNRSDDSSMWLPLNTHHQNTTTIQADMGAPGKLPLQKTCRRIARSDAGWSIQRNFAIRGYTQVHLPRSTGGLAARSPNGTRRLDHEGPGSCQL